ncbi:MAG TPA: hypothetical protein VIL74_14875 [Pyrinomonadaceae bacterium]|jgi:hypothetical protein
MVYIDIPYVAENNRINKDLTKKEIETLNISERAKQTAHAAIYNFRPRGVDFTGNEAIEAILLEVVLKKLGIPYRRINEPESYLLEENA